MEDGAPRHGAPRHVKGSDAQLGQLLVLDGPAFGGRSRPNHIPVTLGEFLHRTSRRIYPCKCCHYRRRYCYLYKPRSKNALGGPRTVLGHVWPSWSQLHDTQIGRSEIHSKKLFVSAYLKNASFSSAGSVYGYARVHTSIYIYIYIYAHIYIYVHILIH